MGQWDQFVRSQAQKSDHAANHRKSFTKKKKNTFNMNYFTYGAQWRCLRGNFFFLLDFSTYLSTVDG